MSDTDAPDRLTRARSEMDIAHAWLLKAESDIDHVTIPEVIVEVERDLLRATAAHSRALRELFLATLEAKAEPPAQRHAYTADGLAYRRLRTISRSRGETGLVAALGSYEVAASLLRNVEG